MFIAPYSSLQMHATANITHYLLPITHGRQKFWLMEQLHMAYAEKSRAAENCRASLRIHHAQDIFTENLQKLLIGKAASCQFCRQVGQQRACFQPGGDTVDAVII